MTGTDEVRRLPAGLVLTSIGYRGKPIRDLPFDDAAAVVPNDGGRVVDLQSRAGARHYVAGWIKRGPTGFIGTNKSCAAQTVHNLVADYNDGLLADPVGKPAALDKLVRSRRPALVDADGLEGDRRRGDRSRRRGRGPATSSPPSPKCWPPRPRPHRRCANGCSPVAAIVARAKGVFQRRSRYRLRYPVWTRSSSGAPVLVWLLGFD